METKVTPEFINSALREVETAKRNGLDLDTINVKYFNYAKDQTKKYGEQLMEDATSNEVEQKIVDEYKLWQTFDDCQQAIHVLHTLKSPRVSPEDIVGITIPISRTRAIINSGLNDPILDAEAKVAWAENLKEPLSELPDEHRNFINKHVKALEDELIVTKKKSGARAIDVELFHVRVKPFNRIKKASIASRTKDSPVDVYEMCDKLWNDLDEYQKALVSLKGNRFRISMSAVVALSTIVDKLTHQLAVHAIKKTIAHERSNFDNKFMFENLTELPLYPLVANLNAYKEFVLECKMEEELDPRCAAESTELATKLSIVHSKLEKKELLNIIKQE